MLAPSTVIATGMLHVRGAEEVRRPHADALAADDVHASLTTWRPRSVRCSFAMPEITAGFSPRSIAAAVSMRVASIM